VRGGRILVTDGNSPSRIFSNPCNGACYIKRRGSLLLICLPHENPKSAAPETITNPKEGFETAAATGVVARTVALELDEPAVFRADHPFIFVIRDNRTGCVLFMGRVANPTALGSWKR
jgi:hypothetical protein